MASENSPSNPVQSDSTSEDDIYVLLQGPAHIRPLNGTGAGIEVIFLDEQGNPTKDPITFTFNPNSDPPFTTLKVTTLQLMVECKKSEFEEAEQKGEVQAYLPKLYERVYKTPGNMLRMNPPDPPFPKPQPKSAQAVNLDTTTIAKPGTTINITVNPSS